MNIQEIQEYYVTRRKNVVNHKTFLQTRTRHAWRHYGNRKRIRVVSSIHYSNTVKI